MCLLTKEIKSVSHDIIYCNTLFCPFYGKIIKVIPRT